MTNFDLKKFLMAHLRRISYQHPARKQVLAAARVERGVYKCSHCNGLFGRNDINVDHTDPVVRVEGWDNWDGIINRLFCAPEGLSVLCKPCHKSKTFLENELRKQYRIDPSNDTED